MDGPLNAPLILPPVPKNRTHNSTDNIIKFCIKHTFFSVWYVVYEQIGQQKSQTQKKIEHKNSDFGLARKVQLTKDKKNIPLISMLPFCSPSPIQRCQCSPVLVQKQERQCPKEGSGCLPWKILFSTILNKYFTSLFHISCPTFSKCLMYA